MEGNGEDGLDVFALKNAKEQTSSGLQPIT